MATESNVPQLVDKKGDDIMESVISYEIAKATWTDLVHSLPKKWFGFSYGLRNANHTQTLDLADIYRRFDFKENSNDEADERTKEEEVSNDEDITQVKVLMALADDELVVGKNHARNGKWIDITMRKVNILLSMDKDVDRQTYLKYINIDLKFVELVPSCCVIFDLEPFLLTLSLFEHEHVVQFRRTSLTGFPAQSVRSFNADALDSPYLLVLNTGITSLIHIESHHRCFPVDTSLIQIESRKSPTAELFDVDSRRISIVTVNTKKYHSDVLAKSQG
ncbi:hypothetical protein Tco_1525543 [Tanacetum coccineum]